jgi:hypothetical protein
MSTSNEIKFALDESTARALAALGLSPETTANTLLAQMVDAPPAVVALLRSGSANIWEAFAVQIRAAVIKDTARDISFNITQAERTEFAQKSMGSCLSPQTAAQAMFRQYLQAPPGIVGFLAGTNPGNVWDHHANTVRADVRQSLVPECEIGAAIRKLMATRQ